jgi:hypothetical protein
MAMPVAMPEVEPIVAIDVVPLVQVPPGEASAWGMVAPMQTAVAPVMGRGSGLMAMTALPVMVLLQPVVVLVAIIV